LLEINQGVSLRFYRALYQSQTLFEKSMRHTLSQ